MVRIGFYLGEKPTEIDISKKGKSILKSLDDYSCIDLETTGLSAEWDEIIEVAAVRVRGGKIVAHYSSLVHTDHLDPFITQLTGITLDMLKDAPYIKDVLQKFKEFVGDDILVGHGVTFDIDFLYNGLARIGEYLTNDFINTLRLSRRVIPIPQVSNHKLSTLVKELNLQSHGSHRALADAEATVLLYEYLKNTANAKGVDISMIAKHAPKLNANDITATVTEFDESHPLFGKVCVFTGTLSIPRKDAMQLVANVGGINADGVNKQTNYLIIGNLEYASSIKNGKSTKQKKAESYILARQDITILDEASFFSLLNENIIEEVIATQKLPTQYQEYATQIKDIFNRNNINTDYLRFAVSDNKMSVLNFYKVCVLVFGKKPYISEKGAATKFNAIHPTIETKQLSEEFHIFLESPDTLNALSSYLIQKMNSTFESIEENRAFNPAFEKHLLKYLKSDEYFKI